MNKRDYNKYCKALETLGLSTTVATDLVHKMDGECLKPGLFYRDGTLVLESSTLGGTAARLLKQIGGPAPDARNALAPIETLNATAIIKREFRSVEMKTENLIQLLLARGFKVAAGAKVLLRRKKHGEVETFELNTCEMTISWHSDEVTDSIREAN
jgi:hypothetical protein